MPCIKLSSGKTVCFGDDNKSTRNQPIPSKKPTTVNISQEVLRTIPQFKDQPQNSGTITPTQEKSFNPLDLLDIPQKVMMKALTTEYIKPSQFMANRDLGNDNQKLAADLLLDPLNLLPIAKGVTLMKGEKYLTPLEKVYNTIRNYGTKIDNTEDIILGTNFQNPTYSQGGTIFFNHQPVHFPDGGQTIKKGPGPFLVPESRPQFKSMPVPNRFDPRFMAYQDSARINQNSVRDLEAFNKAANSKQPYTTSAQTYDENYNTTSAANKSTYTNPRNTKNHLNPSKKIHGLTEEQRGVFHGGFNTADNGTPENLPTALYSADVTNPAMYKDEQLWLPYHTNPVQPYHVEPMELMQSKTPGPLSTSVERSAPAIPQVIPYTPTGKGFSPKTEGLTIQVPTVEVWKEKAAPFSNAVFRQNKINPDARTKLNISFDLDRRELINRGKLDSLRESVGLEPKGYQDGGKNTKTIKLSTGKIITLK